MVSLRGCCKLLLRKLHPLLPLYSISLLKSLLTGHCQTSSHSTKIALSMMSDPTSQFPFSQSSVKSSKNIYTISWSWCVFFDIRKTFGSVPHVALLNKLHKLQTPSVIFCWLISYVSSRFQRVVVNGSCSSWLPVKSGVPGQGSILEPLLFLLYMNDIEDSPVLWIQTLHVRRRYVTV